MTSTDVPAQNIAEIRRSLAPWKCGLVLGVVALGLVMCYFLSPATARPEPGVVLDLPYFILNYPGERQDVSQAELTLLPKDTEFAKMAYSIGGGAKMVCQIVLGGADRRSIHRPEVCLPGQGWTINSTEEIPVKLKNGRDIKVTKLVLTTPVKVGNEMRPLKMVFVYWFVSREFTTPSHVQRIVSDAWDMLFNNKLHRWAYVIVNAPVLSNFVQNGKDEEQTLKMVEEAVAELAPQIMISEREKASP